MDQKYSYLFKYIIIGDSGVGKSSILQNFKTSKFDANSPSTVGIEYIRKILKIDNKNIMVQIWDTAGQENMQSLTTNYYRNCCLIILVYDITNEKSFENLQNWVLRINENANENCYKILIGNKIDKTNREVFSKEAKNFANSLKMPFFEVSAKTSENINFFFNEISHKIYMDVLNGKFEVDDEGRSGIKIGKEEDKLKNVRLEYNMEGNKNKKCC